MEKPFPGLIGNRALADRLVGDIRRGTLAHAYLLSGAPGSGRHTVALSVAAALSCREKEQPGASLPCGVCPSCRKILEGKSPDVIPVKKPTDRATLGVESVRFLREDVLIAPNDTDHKIYIVEDAETMTPQAQNAFLLTLEEPPPYVLFFLIATDARALLETIRSRAPELRTEPIPREDIRDYLLSSGKAGSLSREELEGIVSAADGRIGRALELLHPSERKPILRRQELTRRFLTAKTASEYLPLLTEFGTKREELLKQLSVISLAVRDLLAVRKGAERVSLAFFGSVEEAGTLAHGHSAQTLIAIAEAVDRAAERLSRNANIRLTLTALGKDTGKL